MDIAKIEIDQNIFITLDAFQNELFEASVTRILPLKDERTQTYTMEAKFEVPPKVLYAGLAGEANILLSRKDQVITIPIDFLIDNSKVLTKDGEQEVVLGARNFSHVEVLSGIDTSTVILKPL